MRGSAVLGNWILRHCSDAMRASELRALLQTNPQPLCQNARLIDHSYSTKRRSL